MSQLLLPHIHECARCEATIRTGCERGCIIAEGYVCPLCHEELEYRQGYDDFCAGAVPNPERCIPGRPYLRGYYDAERTGVDR